MKKKTLFIYFYTGWLHSQTRLCWIHALLLFLLLFCCVFTSHSCMKLSTSPSAAFLCLLNSSLTYWSPRAFRWIGRNRWRTRMRLYSDRTLDTWAAVAMTTAGPDGINEDIKVKEVKSGAKRARRSPWMIIIQPSAETSGVFALWGAAAPPAGPADHRHPRNLKVTVYLD